VNAQTKSIPVVDVDNAFPAMVDRPASRRDAGSGPDDVAPRVTTALRDILGWRPRAGDPNAFENALTSAFRLRMVEGHVEADYVPRGYAVQADLGAVTGGQASLYRRATISRTETLRILDALVPLRTDADVEDMDSYRLLVRNGVERLVDEIGAAGGPRVQMVDLYFAGLTGTAKPVGGINADNVSGQLGALRDRFGLTDANVNTVEEEGVRTAYWTLVDLIADLQASWYSQRVKFSGAAGQGFLGTELIILSRLMEAAADQVEELEDVLDSVLITESERRTLLLDTDTGLTLDGLLTWLHDFLSNEGRTLAQDAGRDGIVSALAPMSIELVKTFRLTLADRLQDQADGDQQAAGDEHCCPVVWLPASCCAKLPAGMYAARTRIAVAGLCRLLMELARTAQRIGRWARPVIINVTLRPVSGREQVYEVEFRGINFRPEHIPAFVIDPGRWHRDDCSVEEFGLDGLVLAKRGSTTADEESISGLFSGEDFLKAIEPVVGRIGKGFREPGGVTLPAESLALAVVDGETGRVVSAPQPVTWPALRKAWHALPAARDTENRWDPVKTDERFRMLPREVRIDDPHEESEVPFDPNELLLAISDENKREAFRAALRGSGFTLAKERVQKKPDKQN
jgi:hypothetical protein